MARTETINVWSLLSPDRCGACDAECRGSPLCGVCAQSLYRNARACPRCAAPERAGRGCTCHLPELEGLRAPYLYGGELAVALHRLKYRGRFELARSLGRWIAGELGSVIAELQLDRVCPVPSPWRTRWSRGMDHPALLYRAARPAVPLVSALYWSRRRRPQVGLSRMERVVNLRQALSLRGRHQSDIRGRRILVVDDVITTGATMREAGRALREAGAAAVAGFALARADDL